MVVKVFHPINASLCYYMVYTQITMLGGFILNDGSFMMDGNDGGLNITRDGGKTGVL